MRILALFAFALLLSGCVSEHYSAHLSKKAATDLADVIVQKGGYRLDDFQPPKVIFDSKALQWSAYFYRYPRPPYGWKGMAADRMGGEGNGYILIVIDDKSGTGSGRYIRTN